MLFNAFKKSKLNNAQGFTMFEIVMVIAILAIFSGMIFTVMMSNWESIENHSVRTDFWYEANQIMEIMSFDARRASQITVSESGSNMTADFRVSSDATPFATYQMLDDGTFQYKRDDGDFIALSNNVDFDSSLFEKRGRALSLDLTLTDTEVFGQTVSVNTSTEVYPRN